MGRVMVSSGGLSEPALHHTLEHGKVGAQDGRPNVMSQPVLPAFLESQGARHSALVLTRSEVERVSLCLQLCDLGQQFALIDKRQGGHLGVLLWTPDVLKPWLDFVERVTKQRFAFAVFGDNSNLVFDCVTSPEPQRFDSSWEALKALNGSALAEHDFCHKPATHIAEAHGRRLAGEPRVPFTRGPDTSRSSDDRTK